MDPASRLSPDEEKARYLLHNNDIADPRYQEFVRPLFEEVGKHVPPAARGLDFGSGTGPVLAEMLTRAGYGIRLFDPYFEPDPEALRYTYDFIVASEVVEHLFHPLEDFTRLKRMLKAGGLLAVMTLFWEEGIDFASWYYRRDPTHVAFYSQATFRWIGSFCGFPKVWFPSNRIALLRS